MRPSSSWSCARPSSCQPATASSRRAGRTRAWNRYAPLPAPARARARPPHPTPAPPPPDWSIAAGYICADLAIPTRPGPPLRRRGGSNRAALEAAARPPSRPSSPTLLPPRSSRTTNTTATLWFRRTRAPLRRVRSMGSCWERGARSGPMGLAADGTMICAPLVSCSPSGPCSRRRPRSVRRRARCDEEAQHGSEQGESELRRRRGSRQHNTEVFEWRCMFICLVSPVRETAEDVTPSALDDAIARAAWRRRLVNGW